MTSQYPYDVDLLRNGAGAGTEEFAQPSSDGIHAGTSNLYASSHAPMSTGNASSSAFPPASSYQTPTLFDQEDPLRDGTRAPPTTVPQEKYIIEAREDGAVPPKSQGYSQRNLIIGLFIFLILLGGVLGGALGATLGKHSSSNAATTTSVPLPSTTFSVTSGDATSGATRPATHTETTTSQSTSTTTSASTTTTTNPSSPPLITPGVTYTITNSVTGTVIDFNEGNSNIAGWEANGGQNQRWLVESADDGSWYIRSATGQAYITFKGSQVQASDPLVVVAGNPTQSWVIESNPNSAGSVRIHYPDASLGLSVDLNNIGSANGNAITLWGDNISGAQTWLFSAVVSG